MIKRKKKENVITYGIKYRFYPNEYIDGMFGAHKFFWNKILEKYNLLYEENKKIQKFNETSEEKKEPIKYNLLKGSNPNTSLYNIHSIIDDGLNNLDENGENSPKDYSWLKKYPSSMYENIIVDLAIAWNNYFNFLKNKETSIVKVGKPQKKHKGEVKSVRLRNTSTLTDGKNVINWKKGLIKTPGFNKLGYCKCRLHKKFRGLVKYTTISKDIDDKYYISLIVEVNGSYPVVSDNFGEENVIGIDFGLKTFATISNADDSECGKKIKLKCIDKINKIEEKIRKLQKCRTKCNVTLSRKGHDSYTISVTEMNKKEQENRCAFKGWHKEYSNGYKAYTHKINKLTVKINNIKKNSIGEFASSIVKNDDVNAIAVETLGLRDMTTRDATKKKEGKRLSKKVKFRRAMARKFNKSAIGKTIEQIEYDCKKEGKHFIKAPRTFPSTKTCAVCGYKLPSIELSTRKWTCPNCGKEHDRDMNAAKNLAKYGLRKLKNKIENEEEVVIAESAM